MSSVRTTGNKTGVSRKNGGKLRKVEVLSSPLLGLCVLLILRKVVKSVSSFALFDPELPLTSQARCDNSLMKNVCHLVTSESPPFTVRV